MKLIFKLLVVLLFAVSCSGNIAEADYNIIPLPNSIDEKGGESFYLTKDTKIVYPKNNVELRKNAEFLSEYIKSSTGIALRITPESSPKSINLTSTLSNINSEAYQLSVSAEKVEINGASNAGVFYGIQTLRKSLPVENLTKVVLPQVEIKDEPRFGYRGMMLDVSRHFTSKDLVKRYIDILALHNLNTFHWHLTDDQGWRIEITKYPKLTEIGSKRSGTVIGRSSEKYDSKEYGPYFYTQAEIKEVIDYAAEKFITIIPEIDLPGHMLAALAGYPELGCSKGPYQVGRRWGVESEVLCAGDSATLDFVKNVLSEVMDLFPSKYIHIGGDECPKSEWEKCPTCQALIKKEGFRKDENHTAEEKLQAYFIAKVEEFVNSKGKSIIGWDEILEGGVTPTATIMSWRGTSGGIEAAKRGNDVIMTPASHLYFDHYQSKHQELEPFGITGFTPLEKVYSFNPIAELTDDEAKHVLGVQANLWREYISDFKHVEYMLVPRIAALAEVQWSQESKKNLDNFKKRLIKFLNIYDKLDINYATHIIDVLEEINEDIENKNLVLMLSTTDGAEIRYTDDGSEPTKLSALYTEPIIIEDSKEIKSIAIRGRGITKSHITKIAFNKATLKDIQLVNAPRNFKKEQLVDGRVGEKQRFNSGSWVWFNKDLDATINLGEETEITEIALNTIVETSESVFAPTGFLVYLSVDGKEFTEVYKQEIPILKSVAEYESRLVAKFDKQTAKYIRIVLNNTNTIPDWHKNKGNPAILCVDEIVIN